MKIRKVINRGFLSFVCLTLLHQGFLFAPSSRVAAQTRFVRDLTQLDALPATQPAIAEVTAEDEAAPSAPATAGQLLISEYRLRGTQGANDEFIEIYNNSDAPHLVATTDGTPGYAVVSSSGASLNDGNPTLRCTIPNNTSIPARGHFLCTNTTPLNGYSLATYAAGTLTTATGDAGYTSDIPDNDGLALFNNADPTEAAFTLANRIDAVGSNVVANALYREGAGHEDISPFSIEYSWVRRLPGGCTGYAGGVGDNCTSALAAQTTPAPASTHPQDTDANASDFIFVEPSAVEAGGGSRLGAPGPENLSSPTARDSRLISSVSVDSTAASSSAPNRLRDATTTGANMTFGTLEIRKRFRNDTGANVTRLRFRIVDVTTLPSRGTNCTPGSPGAPTDCTADLRALTSVDTTVTSNDPNTCATTPGATSTAAPCDVPVRGTTLEEVSNGISSNQPNGGGYNSSLSAGAITLASALAPGQSINVRFRLGVQQPGKFRFFVQVEATP